MDDALNKAALQAADYGMHSVTPHLICAGAADAIDFYRGAFGAKELIRLPGLDGKIMHACLSINGSSVMLVDENAGCGMRSPKSLGGTAVTIHLVVEDADAIAAQAVEAGAAVVIPVADQFWGDRYGVVEDPFGHSWAIATPGGAPKSAEELREAMKSAIPMGT